MKIFGHSKKNIGGIRLKWKEVVINPGSYKAILPIRSHLQQMQLNAFEMQCECSCKKNECIFNDPNFAL